MIPTYLSATSNHRFKTLMILSMIFGCFATLALPPYHFFPFLLLAIPGWMVLLDQTQNKKEAWWVSWGFGFGYFVTNLYWISNSLLVDPLHYGWLYPFATVGINSIFALYFAFFGFVFTRIPFSNITWKALVFSIGWVGMEWIRGHFLSGFPWNLMGYVWCCSDIMLQSTYLFTIYGLTFLTILIATTPYVMIKGSSRLYVIIAILLLSMNWLYGSIRLETYPYAESTAIKMRLVQANISQKLHQDSAVHVAILHEHVKLTKHLPSLPDLVIWSESSVPFILNIEPKLLSWFKEQFPENTRIITGITRAETHHTKPQIWNSIAIIKAGKIEHYYDKQHLVPFGEYIPFRAWLPSFLQNTVEKLTFGAIDFSKGKGPKWVELPSIPPFSPLMCYEVIFPQDVTSPHTQPEWLLNLTNDGWFGDSPGPYQHFQMARVRAIEEGLPLIRVANSGITAVVDPLGRILAYAPLHKKVVMDIALPKPLHQIKPNKIL